MNLHALRIFTIVAKLESITEAANLLHISQPAVTAQVRNLEREIGVKLISSKGRGIQLTSEGKFLYEQGLRLFQLEEQIEEKIKTFLEKKEKIQIASSYISTNYILPPIVASYKQENPDVEIYVSLGNVQSVEERVLNYEVDFGLVIQSNIGHEDLYFEKILDVPFWFVVHPTHPLANKKISMFDLSEYDFVYREKGSSTRDLLEAIFYTHNCPLPKFGIEVQGVLESIKFVEAGYGIAIAPACGVVERIEQGKLARVFVKQAEIHQSLFICTRKIEKCEHKFIQYLKKSLIESET
ncbi:LysR family transcriptional regulator [Calidifontibacillus erzurumensis]|uniref:LysR family transcriptional regulator n=1 Tax=Calidifontibacillus erzurumensis TaxID=2741433 RepID=A0A8J8KCP5_9BACI|nr:LysR family transcriptional regulator [Calidifontibacillus erzurumensis]NSL52837.1 LysR family transcriptional regulator [Calidifontibacillus erzurumensis]